jgi:hypothetical protein
MDTDTEATMIPLRGLTVPEEAFDLLLDLERRGLALVVAADGHLIVRPKARITAADDAAIRKHRDALLALVTYCASVRH